MQTKEELLTRLSDCDVSPLTPDENVIAAVRAAKDAEKVLFG